MKNLKKLSKGQLKTIKGAGGIKFPEPEFCMYACPDGTIVCATCSDDFKCPDNSI